MCNYKRGCTTVGLGKSRYDLSFIGSAATLPVMSGATNIAVIQFHNAGELILCISLHHISPNMIQKMPCGIISKAQCMAQLNGRDPSFISSAQVDCPKPNGQWQTGSVHDSSCGYRGLMAAGTTLKSVSTPNGIVLSATTNGINKSLGGTHTK